MDSKVTVDAIVDNKFRPGKKQAQLRMTVTTTSGGSNNLRSDLYTNEELGREEYTENRVDWIDVPEDATVESVSNLLENFPQARIMKFLSNTPILSDTQKRIIERGLTGEAFEEFKTEHNIQAEDWNQECANKMLEVISNSQVVRYAEGNKDNKPAGEPILDSKGQIQYRLTVFNKEGVSDIDKRSGVAVLASLALAENPSYVSQEVTQ